MDVNLVLFKKNGLRKTFPLPSSVTVIGRRHNCDLCVPLMSVSRRHCQLHTDNGVLKLRDLGSRSGTYLNGKRITDEVAVRAGDCIKVGPLAFVFQIDGQPETIDMPESLQDKSLQKAAPTDLAAKDLEASEKPDDLAELEESEELEDLGELDDLEELDEFEGMDDLNLET